MRNETGRRRRKGVVAAMFVGLVAIGAAGMVARFLTPGPEPRPLVDRPLPFQKRTAIDTSGFSMMVASVQPWDTSAMPSEIRKHWIGVGERAVKAMEKDEAAGRVPLASLVPHYVARATLLNAEGDTDAAAEALKKARTVTDRNDALASRYLSSLIYFQGVTAFRQGENDNCIMCRGDSSCILPIVESARHSDPTGSTAAIRHLTDLLERFPDDLEAMWLLNLAHMTLGQYPDGVAPRFVLDLGPFMKSEFDIGRFRDVGHDAGVNRFDQAGGAILEDFDGDGRLDLFVTSFDPKEAAGFYRNKGDGTFEDRSASAGLKEQFGGLYCVQADYDNDGLMDVFIPRGAWLGHPMRPSLLKNRGAASSRT